MANSANNNISRVPLAFPTYMRNDVSVIGTSPKCQLLKSVEHFITFTCSSLYALFKSRWWDPPVGKERGA